jgi:N-acetylglucosamine-6-phosphate deacetylase
MDFALTNARTVTPLEVIERGTVVIEKGRIARVGAAVPAPPGYEVMDLEGRTLAPGYVDVHVHGGGGFSLMDGDAAQVRSFARWAVCRGVTSFLITSVTAPHEHLLALLRSCAPLIDAARSAATGEWRGARPLGFNFEGPFISPERAGAQSRECIRTPDARETEEYLGEADGRLRIMTLAPELPGADSLIDALLRAGAVPSLGHSDATYEEARRAFERGVSHVTHAFNAMRPLHQRDPGCLAAALNEAGVTVELIGDGVHVHPGAMELLLRAKGAEKTALVSDAMPFAGLGDGDFDVGGQRVTVEGGRAARPDGGIAGGTAMLDQIVRHVVGRLPVRLEEAVRMATLNPAAVIGMSDRKGRIAAGANADLVVLDEGLEVAMTFVGGEKVFERE